MAAEGRGDKENGLSVGGWSSSHWNDLPTIGRGEEELQRKELVEEGKTTRRDRRSAGET